MKDITIAFFDAKNYDIKSFDAVNKDYGFSIKYFTEKLNPDTAKLAAGCQAVCAFVNDNINKDVIDILHESGVGLLAMRCAGYNNIDLKSAHGKLRVVRVPAYSPYAVAEHALALMMTLNRKTHRAFFRTRDNNFNINGFLGFDMHGKTAGVIGTGKIGKIMINILKGLGMSVLAYDLYPDLKFSEETGVKYESLEEIYKNSDVITLHCPLTKESHHMINENSLAVMKPNVMIINTSRGHLIDTKALINALKLNKVGSAGLDVYEEEEDYFFEDFSGINIEDDNLARLLTFNNVLVTSHQAFFTDEAMSNIANTTLNNIRQFFTNNIFLDNEVCCKCGS